MLPEERLPTLECCQVARWIAGRVAEGVAPSQLTVLSRRRYRLTLLQDELRTLHIAAEQPETTELRDTPGVQDVVALLDALVSNGHDLSLARALRSLLFSLSDADLVWIAVAQREARAADSARSAAASST